jgi:hypothetical protein
MDKKFRKPESDNIYNKDENDGDKQNVMLELDDGSGRIVANGWGVKEEDYNHIQRGSLVEIIGPIRPYKENKYLLIEIIQKHEDPNFEIYRDLEMIKKRLSGPKESIKQFDKGINIEDREGNLGEKDLDMIDELMSSEGTTPIGATSVSLNDLETKIVDYVQQNDAGSGVQDMSIAAHIGKSLNDTLKILESLSQKNLLYSCNANFWSSI